jgi:Ca-activated chloride channel family protein
MPDSGVSQPVKAMKTPLALFVGAFALLVSSFAVAGEQEGKTTEGRLDAFAADGKALGPCPLKHTDVQAALSGTLARVTVTQQFHNPFKNKIEAIYVFPLHQDSAVDDMTMTVGERVVKGVIKERGEAQRIYEKAKAEGKVASLLDQERPNIFTQSVANIEPGEQVTITISYSQTMTWEDGRFEFDFPTVVGPRYIPGETPDSVHPVGVEPPMPPLFRKQDPQRGPEGEAPVVNPDPAKPTGQVPDANRITPPVVEEGYRAGHDLSITVTIEAGRLIEDLKSALHEVEIDHPGGDQTRAVVRLAEKAVLPNRDFAISYRTAGDAISDAVLTHTDERGNFFLMVLQPPARVKQEQVVPRELVFVLDTSGSMSGFPMETSKAMMRRAIENLRPEDKFNIVTFAGDTSVLFPAAVANTEQSRHKALQFIDTLQGAGGTEMMKAINTALGGEHDAKKVRIVCFLTDGYIGNDMAIIGAVKEHAKTTRVFGFGIGHSVNRFLMDAMAQAGRGESHYVLSHEQAKKSADKFYERIDAPVLTDIALDFSGIEVEEVYPKRVEDLFAAKPVVVKGRYTKPGTGVIKLKGTNAAGAFEREIPVTFAAENPGNAVLASQWARAKVDDLMMHDMTGIQQGQVSDELKKEIIGLGLTYNLLTQFTSFVAVEELKITEGGKARTIRVPVEMPQGVSYSGVFGEAAGMGGGGFAMRRMSLSADASPRARGIMPASSSYAGDSDETRSEMKEEAVLEQLEKTPAEGNSTPADKRAKLLGLKLDESLRKLAATGGTQPVEVRVTLRDFSDDAIAKLEALGFKLLAKATSVKLIIGTIPADKLEELSLLEVVRRIDPATP